MSEKFRLMAENANDIIVTLDNDGIITYVTKKIERLIGLPAEVVTGKHFVNFFPSESAVKALQYFRAPMEGDPRLEHPPLRLEAFTRDRNKVNIEVSTSRIFDGDKILSRICVIRDITNRIKEEEKLNQKLNEYLSINKVISIATGGEFIEQKLRNIIEEFHNVLDFASARVILMDRTGDFIQITQIYPEVTHRLWEGEKISIKNTIIEKIMLNRKSVIIPVIKEDERAILSDNMKSAIIIPMILINSFIGVIIIESPELYKYTDSYPDVFNSISQIIGMTIRIHKHVKQEIIDIMK
jgi:PAS domain S-box-containing protein